MPSLKSSSKPEWRIILPLALPVLISQVAQMAMGLVDTLMAARVSPVDMAAVAVGSSIWFPVILFGAGILMVFAPIIAQLNGGNKQRRIFHYMNQGFWLTFALSLLVMIVVWNTDKILPYVSKDTALADKATFYLHAILWGAPGFLGFVALRSLNEGLSLTRPAMYVGLGGLLLNIPLNYICIYGKLGVPALGGAGCGVATAIVYWAMFLLMLVITLNNKKHRRYNTLSLPHKMSWATTWNILKIGVPAALALLCEVGLFCVSALLIAGISTLAVAAHQIAINVSSLLFMVPLSLGTAVSIRVAHNLGENNLARVKESIKSGFILGISIAVLSGTLTFLLRYFIADCYTKEADIIAMAGFLLLFCAIYQISDAIQLMSASVLRGYKDTFAVMVITLVSYWCIAMPLGYTLGRTDLLGKNWGAAGFWVGFIIGLSVCALLLSLRIRFLRKKLGHHLVS